MIVYIVFKPAQPPMKHDGSFIESVWTSLELARSAIEYHAFNSNVHPLDYTIVEREVNTAKNNNTITYE